MALVVAVLTLVLAVGGTSYAAVKIAANSIGAKQLKANAVTGVKVKDGSLAPADFAAGQLPAGAKGATGPAGAAGPAGVPGSASGWALIDSTGNVVRSGGAKPLTDADVTRASAGVYNINGSGWGFGLAPVSVGATLEGATPGLTTYSASNITSSGGFFTFISTKVRTFNTSGTPTDRDVFVWIS